MIYIPYPRTDLDTHRDLVSWRNQFNKKEGDWSKLKDFLAEAPRIINGKHPIPKCWYSELPQGDDFAKDVEHFRPKNQASPLSAKHIREVEKSSGVKYEQEVSVGNYQWLEFDYRNYRLVTAKTNRGGAKHVYFPLAKNTIRLCDGQFPWIDKEFSYFLDPTDKYDTSLLFVKPNGEIAPIAPKTQLTQTDFDNLPATWKNDGFNYIRAFVTIKMYRLNDAVFVKGRKEVYDKMTRQLDFLIKCISSNVDEEIMRLYIEDIIEAVLPSAPFALAAKCALFSFFPSDNTNSYAVHEINTIISNILSQIDNKINNLTIDWRRP